MGNASTKQLEQARILLAKAREDEQAVSVMLCHADVAPAILGFHSQQAAEKLLKALLSAHRVFFRHSHNLSELIAVLDRSGHPLPDEFRSVEGLTAFAVEFRYDLFAEHSDFDGRSTLGLIGRLREYVECVIKEASA